MKIPAFEDAVFRILVAFILFIPTSFCKDDPEITRPSFPDVFQTEIEGTFLQKDGAMDINIYLYYDRINNRAAFNFTSQSITSHTVYNFDTNQIFSTGREECDVTEIPDESKTSFFDFTIDGNKKKRLVAAEEFLYFTKAEFDRGRTEVAERPQLIYLTNTAVPKYEETNCAIIHAFSKPSLILPDCDYRHCTPTLMKISVKCEDETGNKTVDHTYDFFHFTPKILDETVFYPRKGIHCKDLKNTKMFPKFPPFFSFTFDVFEKIISEGDSKTYSSHKKVWYDSDYKILRIDEFDQDKLRRASRIYDIQTSTAFFIITSMNRCTVNKIDGDLDLAQTTLLPDIFFNQESNEMNSVYAGKRKVNELEYDVWSFSWEDPESQATLVEDTYFLEVVENAENDELKDSMKPELKVTHTNEYEYETDDDNGNYYLSAFKLYSVNDFRSNPREWEAFDVSPCFNNAQQRTFRLQVKGPSVVDDSHAYHEILEKLYEKLVAAAGISVLRINRLRGVFNGVELTEMKGAILDYTPYENLVDWKGKVQPGMNKSIELIYKAADDGKLSLTLESGKTEAFYNISAIKEEPKPDDRTPPPDVKPPDPKGYSGATVAAVGMVLLLIGVAFGVSGYYVFLKKRRRQSTEPDVAFLALKSEK